MIIPAAVRQLVCPVVGERHFAELAAWDRVGYGLDFGPAKTMTLNNIYVRTFEAGDLLDGGEAAGFGTSCPSSATTRRRGPARRAGRSTGEPRFMAWLSGGRLASLTASLCPRGRSIRAPTGSSSTCRCWSRSLEAGQTLTARLRSTTSYDRGTNVAWTLAVRDAAGRQVRHQSLDLEKGYLP